MKDGGDRSGGEPAEVAGSQERELGVELARDRPWQARQGVGYERDALGAAYPTERPVKAWVGRDERGGLLAAHQAGEGSDAGAWTARDVAGTAHDPGVDGGETEAGAGGVDGEHTWLASGWVADGHSRGAPRTRRT